MSRVLRPLALALAALTLGLAVVQVVLRIRIHALGGPTPPPALAVAIVLAMLVPAGVGTLLVLRRPGLLTAWILLVGGSWVTLIMTADASASWFVHRDPGSALGPWSALVAQEWMGLFAWPLALAFVYPDGRLPSRRWRPAATLAAASVGLGCFTLLWVPRIDDRERPLHGPLDVGIPDAVVSTVFWCCWGGLLLALFLGFGALVTRYRRGDADERRRVAWLTYGLLLFPLWLGGGSLLGLLLHTGNADGFILLMQAWPAVAVWIAVTRHGLYAIDRLVNRTLVYVALTALLGGAWALVALAAGRLGGSSATGASLATLAAAAAFLPLRARIQALVDRRFARRRFDAVRLVRDFLDDVRDGHAEPEDVGLVLAVALSDPSAAVAFRLPETGAYADRLGHLLGALPEDGRARSVIGRDQRELGVLLHDPVLLREPGLLRAVLDAAAVPAELARLRVELRLQLAEVESSRARIAQAGYEERRRIERDLHDGAQQRLVTLGIVLRRLQRSLPKEAAVLVPALDAAVDEVAGAIADLRTLAAGVRPPRLDEGLAAALADLARGSAVPVEVAATPDRAPPEVEAAAYFVACEALTNAVKHGSPSRVVLRTARDGGLLRLEVEDDGVGGAAPHAGTGLAGMADRVAAQGGRLAIHSPAGAGTRIHVELPCAS